MRDLIKKTKRDKLWIENNRERARFLWRRSKKKNRALKPKKVRILKTKYDENGHRICTLKYSDRAMYQRMYQRIYKYVRKHRFDGAFGKFSEDDIKTLMESQKGLCIYCEKDIKNKFHIDHIQPLSRGGTNFPSNLQLLCPRCNVRKNAKNHEEFLSYLGRAVS